MDHQWHQLSRRQHRTFSSNKYHHAPSIVIRKALFGDDGESSCSEGGKEEEEGEFDLSQYSSKDDSVDNLLGQVLSGPSSAPWMLPNDFETFLNQCCIQSFLFLVRTMRDPHTVLWVEGFTQPTVNASSWQSSSSSSLPSNQNKSNATTNTNNDDNSNKDQSKLLTYHGLAAINTTLFPTWDTYFLQLLEQPELTLQIESDLPHIPSYELEIKPASLCYRMISVREQIAREFVKDLQVISTLGGHTMESYWNRIKQQAAADTASSSSSKSSEAQKLDPLREATGHRPNLLFLELNVDGEDLDHKPSPLRGGNFDLLILLATQEAIHRVLNDPDRQKTRGTEESYATNQYLQNFYTQRLQYFFGRQRYGQADSFLQQLLSQPPSLVQSSEDSTCLIDPVRLTELLLRARQEVALEWRRVAENVPEAHVAIKRQQLNLLMGISNDDGPAPSTFEEGGLD